MQNNKNSLGYIRKRICYFLSSLLVSSKHKAQFERYISSGVIDKEIAVELYDNLLFNFQQTVSKIMMLPAAILFYDGGFLICVIGVMVTLLLSVLITYYPFRIILNLIYPKEYKNGSNKNYLIRFNLFNLENRKKLRKHIAMQPMLKNAKHYISNPWKCPNCKNRHFTPSRVCRKCRFEKYWKCTHCSKINLPTNTSCVDCDMSKSESEYLIKKWICNQCKEEHQNLFTDCWKCGKEKTK